MNTEDTLYFDQEEQNMMDETTKPQHSKVKKNGMSSKAKVAVAGGAGVAAGAVVGAGAVGVAVAANQNHEEPVAEATETGSNSEVSEPIIAETDPATSSEEPQHLTHVTNNYYTTEVHNHQEPVAEVHTEEMASTPVNHEIVADPVDDDVRILGVETVHHPAGFDMDVIGVAVGDDPALFIDMDQDGYLEVFVHDDNHNDHIEDNEIYDISRANLHITDLGVQIAPDDIYATSEEDPMDNFDDPNIMPV